MFRENISSIQGQYFTQNTESEVEEGVLLTEPLLSQASRIFYVYIIFPVETSVHFRYEIFDLQLSIFSFHRFTQISGRFSMVTALQTVLYPQWSVVKVMQMIIFFIIFPFLLLSTMDQLVLNPRNTFGHPNSHSHAYTILFVADIDNSVKSITYYLSIRFHKTTMSGILKTFLN